MRDKPVVSESSVSCKRQAECSDTKQYEPWSCKVCGLNCLDCEGHPVPLQDIRANNQPRSNDKIRSCNHCDDGMIVDTVCDNCGYQNPEDEIETEEFSTSQWWYKELEAVAKSPDQRRAMAVVRNLMSQLHNERESREDLLSKAPPKDEFEYIQVWLNTARYIGDPDGPLQDVMATRQALIAEDIPDPTISTTLGGFDIDGSTRPNDPVKELHAGEHL